LDDWSLGELTQAPAIGQVAMGKNQIPAALYSGYGPVIPGPRLKANAAIQSGAEAQLRLAFPEQQGIEQALAMMHSYATLGGRSRNGWGAVELVGGQASLPAYTRDEQAGKARARAHALGP